MAAAARRLTQTFSMNLGDELLQDGAAHKWLLDPPREGAFAMTQSLAELHRARNLPNLPSDASSHRVHSRHHFKTENIHKTQTTNLHLLNHEH